jgi:hypothetical protein
MAIVAGQLHQISRWLCQGSTLQYSGHGNSHFGFSNSSISASMVGMFQLLGIFGSFAARGGRPDSIVSVHSAAKFDLPPNLSLNSDPACILLRSLSTSRFLGFV